MPLADDLHIRGLIGIFSDVQKVNCPAGAREAALGRAATEYDFDPFVACGRRTLRGFGTRCARFENKMQKIWKKCLQIRH